MRWGEPALPIDAELVTKLDGLGWHQIHPDNRPPAGFIEEIERIVGSTLPADYRGFLSHYPCDSGPDKSVVSPIVEGPAGGGNPSLLVCFGHSQDGIWQRLVNDVDWHIPGMMIIGDDIFGNWFYPDLDAGPVWFFDRDGDGKLARECLALVGHNFTDFILRMEIDEANDLPSPVPTPSLIDRLRDWLI